MSMTKSLSLIGCASVALLAGVAQAGVDTMWTRLYPTSVPVSPLPGFVSAVRADATGNLYAVGGANHGSEPNQYMMTLKYGPTGDLLWSTGRTGRALDEIGNAAQAVAADGASNIYVVGSVNNERPAEPAEQDLAWAKYNSAGTELWYDTLGTVSADVLNDAIVGPDGHIYVCGGLWNNTLSTTEYLVMKIHSGTGDTIWTRRYMMNRGKAKVREPAGPRLFRHPGFYENWDEWENCATALALAPDGSIVVTGFGLDTLFEREWWTMKFTSDGTRVWAVTYHNPVSVEYEEDDVAFDVAVATNGNIYVAGFDFFDDGINRDERTNFCVVRYDGAGNRLGYVSITGPADLAEDCATALCLDNASPQNVYITGWAEYNLPAVQILTHKFSSDLSFRAWGNGGARYGLIGEHDFGYDIFYRSGRVYLTGSTGRDLPVVCYSDVTTFPSSPTPLWDYVHKSVPGDTMTSIGTALWVNDTNHVYVGGQTYQKTGNTGWSAMFAARLFNRRSDVGASAVVVPSGNLPRDTVVRPAVRIANFGNSAAICSLRVVIRNQSGGTVYDTTETGIFVPDTGAVRQLAKTWTASPVGAYNVTAHTIMNGDLNPTNDTARGACAVQYTDAAVRAIIAPTGRIDSGTVVMPRAVVANYGTQTVAIPVTMRIGAFYTSDTTRTLAAGATDTVRFRVWTASRVGTHTVVCTTRLAGDQNPGNNRATDSVTVVPLSAIGGPGVVPAEFAFETARPNPFRAGTAVRYTLPTLCRAEIRVFNASGREVMGLSASQLPGIYRWVWNGCDASGRSVPSGVYYCRFRAGDFRADAKLVKTE